MGRTCQQCDAPFEVTDKDLEFYDKVSPVFDGQKYPIPSPTLCPDCRYQRRLAWRNEQTLYFRTCDGTGEKIMSAFSAEKPFPIYQSEYWYSDKWDAKDYARDFDFGPKVRPFFEQFEELMNSVPQVALSVFANENSDFINQAGWNKNCYLIFEADHNDTCFYSNFIQESRDCMDTYVTLSCELCYECINCQNSYNLKFSQNCVTCSDSWFLQDCIGCRSCFGSVNLKNKEYYFFNEKCTKEEYEEKLQTLDLTTVEGLNQIREKFEAFALKFPRKYIHGIQNENSTGDYLSNTQNCFDCYSLDHCQDCRFVTDSRNMKNDYDVTVFGAHEGAEYSYECHEIGNSVRNICFSDQIWNGVSDVYYSKLCLASSTQLFGCVGMKHAKYCILNKQYSKEEYEKLVPRIIEHMQKTGEWGEFFPAAISPYGYNETLANDYYPLSKEDALAKGFKWKDPEASTKPKAQPFEVPKTIQAVTDDITKQLLTCKTCKDAYKIIAQELKFYRRMELPIPVNCYKCRHKARFALRNPRRLYDRKCDKCGVDIKSSYAPDPKGSPGAAPGVIVYCEKCYLEAVY